MSQPIPADYLSVDCWTMLSRPSAAGTRTGPPAGVRVRALVQGHCKTKGSGWCRNATSQETNYTTHSLPAFGEGLQALLNTILVNITISQYFSSELMTVKTLCFTKYHKISLYNDTEFRRACLLGGGRVDSWRKAGKWRRGFAEIVCGKRRGLDKSLILQRKEETVAEGGFIHYI